MSGSDDGSVTDARQRPDPPPVTVELYREETTVAALAAAGEAVVVFGYAERLAGRLEADGLTPDRYLGVAPDSPAWYPRAMREAGARVHDDAELRERAAGLYADGFTIAPGVGVVPCTPTHTVVVRVRCRGGPVDVVLSNAPEDEAVGESLSGALPLYGSLDTDGGPVSSGGARTVCVVGAAWVLAATGERRRARAAGADVGAVEFPAGASRVDLTVRPTGVVERRAPTDAGRSEDAAGD
jgi:hypothetical protein